LADQLFPIVNLDGVEIHAVTETQAVEHILAQSEAGAGGVVITPNLDHLRRCSADVNFAALVAEADLVVADGMPLVWACKLRGTPLPQRVAGSDLISSLSAGAAVRKRSVFLLGGATGSAEAASRILTERYPGLRVVGTLCPPHGFEQREDEMARIRASLSNARPDIVFVALGSPKQENLISMIKNTLPAAWFLGVGVSFSFLTGEVKRAPKWMQKSGLEWIHRLIQEPRHLFKRYIIDGLPFAGMLLLRSAMEGASTRFRGRKLIAPVATRSNAVFVPPADLDVRPVDLSPATLPVSRNDLAPTSLDSPVRPHGLEHRSLHRLRTLVLLGGMVRQTALTQAVGRTVLDLPLDDRGSILNHWLNHAVEVARICNISALPVRILVDRNSPEPVSADEKYYGTFRVERDQSEYRGTGGVLADLADEYEDDDLIIVANASQVLLDPLAGIVGSLEKTGGDIALVGHEDGTPSGVMLITVKTLRIIPRNGFVDMKEQGLPLIASKFDVRVVNRRRPSGLPVRSMADYLSALRLHHRRLVGKPARLDPLAEDWKSSFGIVEPGATVDPSVRVHDSVILKGATVRAGAAVVRSVVCSGASVAENARVVETFERCETGKK